MPCPKAAPHTDRTGSAAAKCGVAAHRAAPRWQRSCRSRSGIAALIRRETAGRRCPEIAVQRSRAARALAHGQHAAAHLIELERLEQRLEIAFAETLVALALDDLEEARANDVLREDLQQQPLALGRGAVDQDATLAQALQVLAVPGNTRVDSLIVRIGCVLKAHTARAHAVYRGVDVVGA